VDIGELLDDGAKGVAQGLTAVALAVVLLLGVAVFVPVAIVAGVSGTATTGTSVVVSFPPQPANANGHPTTQSVSSGLLAPSDSRPVDVARRYLGVPYVFGGTNPTTGLDCSALVQLVFSQLGVRLPRTAQLQYDATARVTRDHLQPGDLVFFARTYADRNDWITHVGIYMGDGKQINAPTEGQVVSIQPVFSGFWGEHFASGGRITPG
jgi:cell wall-associated NlpC family hydrolase